MIKILLLLIIILSLSLSASSQNLQWAKKFGVNGYDQGQALTIDATSNVYTAGIFSGTVDFDPGTPVYNLTASSSGIFILKLDALGNFGWAKSISGTGGYSNGFSIKVDVLGNVIITGQFNGTLDFDPGAATFNLTSAGFADIFILKLDASGNFVWAKNMGGTNEDQGLSSSLDAAGNIYTTGYFRGTSDFDPGPGVFTLISAGFSDIFIAKLNASGNFVWVKSIGTFNTEQGNEITTDPLGNVLITGSFVGTMDFDPGAAIFNMTASGISDAYIFKLDANGTFVWAKSFSGPGGEVSWSIVTDPAGNIYTTGYFNGTADFNPGPGVANLVTQLPQDTDIFVSKLDASGNYVWAKSMGGLAGGGEGGLGIAVDGAGNVYTTGFFNGTVDFDPGAGVYNLTTTTFTNQDVYVSKLDVNGNFVWAGKWGGTVDDQTFDIDVDAIQNIYTTGYFEGTVDFDPGPGTFNLTSIAQDIFISKLGITALPLSLLSFEISQKENDAYLLWKTISESNTDKFEIERSEDGTSFKKTATVKASANSNTTKSYTFKDKDAGKKFLNQTLYYRLKQIDLDGRYTYSPVRSIIFKFGQGFQVYPNPAVDLITIQTRIAEVGLTFSIKDQTGRQVLKGKIDNITKVADISRLAAGVYFVQLGVLNNETIKLIKL